MNIKRFVSLNLFFILIFLIITGIVLYIMPHGRVAYWTGWNILGLGKEEWDNLHIIFGFLFIIFGIWHVYLNWGALKLYLKDNKLLLYALLLNAFFMITAIKDLPPSSWIINLGEQIKASWKDNQIRPPMPHAELMPLQVLCERLGIPLEEAIKVLESKGIKVSSPNENLRDLYKESGVPPYKIYEYLVEISPRKSFNFGNRGGRGRWRRE